MNTAVSSMTGFARADGAHGKTRWTWELKSVNGRGLEMRFRLPPGYDALEPKLRTALSAKLKRGSIFSNLQIAIDGGETRMRLNEEALSDVIAAVEKIRNRTECDPPRADGIVAVRGVMEAADDDLDDAARAALNDAILRSFEDAVALLANAREKEGAAMMRVVAGHVDDIERLTAEAEADPGAALSAIRDRIAAQLAELMEDGAVAEDRLAQEAAVMAVKADVREELNRLTAHVAAARELLKRGGAVGRELDFLTQELNRETNTLCSKAQNMDLKRTGLELKKVIDQLREQVQNVE